MASNQKLKSERKRAQAKKVKPCDLAEVSVPADYPFGPLLCRKEHESLFSQLFQTPAKTKEDLK